MHTISIDQLAHFACRLEVLRLGISRLKAAR